MKSFIRVIALSTFIMVFATLSAVAADLPNFVPLAKNAGPAVVNISSERKIAPREGIMRGMPPGMDRFFDQFGPFFGDPGARRQSSLGSGFIISTDGYIVTNNHVVEGADSIVVTLQSSTNHTDTLNAVIIGTDADTDLALLKVETDKALPILTFGDSDALEVGEWVFAIGNPFGLSHSVTAGILSAKGRDIHAGPFDNFLQTDASINPGNSGGPLLNLKGEVIGINTAIVATGQGIGFAIPSSLARRIVEELKTGKPVSRGWLGITIQDIDEGMVKALGLPNAKGVLIGSVLSGEPAEKAGMRAGDVIIRISQSDVASSSELLRVVADIKPGTEVKVALLRDGRELTVNVELGERSTGQAQRNNPSMQQQSDDSGLGISVRPLTGDDIRALQIPSDTKGLLIAEVRPGSPAAHAGLHGGDIILSVNLSPVTSPADFAEIVKKYVKERGAVMLQINRKGTTFFVTVDLQAE